MNQERIKAIENITLADIKAAYGYQSIRIHQKYDGPYIVNMYMPDQSHKKMEIDVETMVEVHEALMNRKSIQ